MSAKPLPGAEAVERALQDSETRLQQVLDNTSALIFAKNAQGHYIFVNREFERASGRRAAEILGRDDEAIFPPDLVARFRHNDLRVLQEGRSIEFEEVADFGAGPRTYLAAKFPLFDADGAAYAVCGMATDITDRKRLEEALTVSALAVSQSDDEALYRQLVQYLATILGVEAAFVAVHQPHDPNRLAMLAFFMDGQVRENFTYDQHGTPCETVVGHAFQLYPSDLGRLFPLDADFRKLRFDSYAGHPLIDANGRPLGLIAVASRSPIAQPAFVESVLRIFAVRVTAELERDAARNALRASEANYREIFEASEDAIFVHDWDTGAIVDANPRACETYGYARTELLGRRPQGLAGEDVPFSGLDALREVETAKREGSASLEWCRRRRDGSTRCEEVRLKRATIGGQRRVLAIARDITERKAAEEALRTSEEQYHAIFNASADAMVLWDPQFRRVDVNPAFESMYGWTRQEVIGRGFDFPEFTDEHRRLREELVQRALNGEICQSEHEVVGKGGKRFYAEVHAIPFRHGSQPHVLVIARDITERKAAEERREQLEARLRQAQKMEAIGQLTGGIAHDFNNLLTTIMGYATLASEREAARDDPLLAGYLQQAQRACARARDLIQQMLMFSRGQRGSPQVLRLDTLVGDAVPGLRAQIGEDTRLELRAGAGVTVVRVDPVQAEQVLTNLVLNARDALGGPGRIEVGVRDTHVEAAVCAGCRAPVDGDYVELSVADDGPGIDPATAERIFEPFFTTKETGKGTGMGLAIVHGIVHEHGGHVVLESAKGRGARFRVLLPTATPESVPPAPAPADACAVGAAATTLPGHVLVVDDEESVAHFMRELLESWGVRAQCVLSGEAALALVEAEPARFDLVVTDQAMPRMSGLDLVRRLRDVRADMPVIVHTGNVDAMPALAESDARPSAVLQKPVDPARLRTVLAQCVKKRTDVEQRIADRG